MSPAGFQAEAPTNFERKVPVVLVLDTSGSMSGTPIDLVNEGMRIFQEEVMSDATARARGDIAVVTFGGEVTVVRPFGLIDGENPMPNTLQTNGGTPLVDGTFKAIQLLKERIDWYFESGQDCYRPYLLIMTDGAPDAGQNVEKLKVDLQQLQDYGYDSPKHLGHPRKFNVFVYGVDGADEAMLARFSPRQPLKLRHEKFREFFKYIATVTKAASKSKPEDKLNVSPKNLQVEDPFDVMA
ncbi:MAG: VWA domain-containing protein [Betaproteobacteria bacterium]